MAASLLLVAACGSGLPSALPSLDITHPIASAPSEAPSEEPSAEPTKTPKATAEATDQSTGEPTTEPTEETSVEPSLSETTEPSEVPSEAPGGHVITVFAGGGGQAVAPGVAPTDAAFQRPTGIAIELVPTTAGTHYFEIVDANLGILARINPYEQKILLRGRRRSARPARSRRSRQRWLRTHVDVGRGYGEQPCRDTRQQRELGDYRGQQFGCRWISR